VSATQATDPVIVLRGVGKSFDDVPGGQVALTGVDLTVERGEFVTLVGPSGCGKSTLLRLIAGLTSATHGTITVNGRPAAQARSSHEYGIVFQAPVLFEWRTVRENVELPLEVLRLPRAERARRAAGCLDLVGLEDAEERFPHQLSGGMQQRVSLARALALHPTILLMDEPFSALDELSREKLNLELLRVRSELDVTVVFVTHDVDEAVFLSDRVVVLTARPGRVQAIVSVDLGAPRTADTRASRRFFDLTNKVRALLKLSDASVVQLLQASPVAPA
jgi:NitT/TauT family transport system ATP-binding protein